MPSPFPGIDPYIEIIGIWESFHSMLNPMVTELLNERLPAGYAAQSHQRVKLYGAPAKAEDRLPDVFVARRPGPRPDRERGGVAVLDIDLEPTTIPIAYEQIDIYERWVEVVKLPELELVTAIELLSPSNKHEPGRGDYLEKRATLLKGPAHLVEIDLLLAGPRMPMERRLPTGDCFAIVARAERRPDAEVYAWSVRRRLPTIPVPLRAPDPDVPLDLARAYALAYDRGGYGRVMTYDQPLPKGFPLSPDDRAWAEAIVRESER